MPQQLASLIAPASHRCFNELRKEIIDGCWQFGQANWYAEEGKWSRLRSFCLEGSMAICKTCKSELVVKNGFVRGTRRTVDQVPGNRDTATFQSLYQKVKHLEKCIFIPVNGKNSRICRRQDIMLSAKRTRIALEETTAIPLSFDVINTPPSNQQGRLLLTQTASSGEDRQVWRQAIKKVHYAGLDIAKNLFGFLKAFPGHRNKTYAADTRASHEALMHPGTRFVRAKSVEQQDTEHPPARGVRLRTLLARQPALRYRGLNAAKEVKTECRFG
ncbi:MAG: hypothetical protein LBS77_03790 [Desulfovibrio sp.]|jgi:hypothetical protein|nr:hypothetical protein [Desulfovibrio sp.]